MLSASFFLPLNLWFWIGSLEMIKQDSPIISFESIVLFDKSFMEKTFI